MLSTLGAAHSRSLTQGYESPALLPQGGLNSVVVFTLQSSSRGQAEARF